ncbi:MAG: phosphatidate cytidylyltransferase [Rickettsiales bacterium]|jgi:phosphatidate cytidylyltransferase|nr:phosphatidate cytidylyltransferase [Rickettsiales bacterium]
MSETIKRILTAGVMVLVGAGAVIAEYFGAPAVRWLCAVVAVVCSAELIWKIIKNKDKRINGRQLMLFILYSLIFIVSAYMVGTRPWIILLLLMTISFADIGAWFFGKFFGGEKMWPSVSPGKTWSGQVAGIVCGTLGAVLYGYIGTALQAGHLAYAQFMPQLMWIGISVSLLSQYGDLAASAIKRKLGIKDYSNILPGHGGALDRFDGWIFVLPITWLVMVL